MLDNLRRYGWIALISATAMTAITAFQTSDTLGDSMTVLSMSAWNAVIWYVWAALAPLIIALCQRHPIELRVWNWRPLAWQVLLAFVFIVLHSAIAAALMQISPRWFGMGFPYGTMAINITGLAKPLALPVPPPAVRPPDDLPATLCWVASVKLFSAS